MAYYYNKLLMRTSAFTIPNIILKSENIINNSKIYTEFLLLLTVTSYSYKKRIFCVFLNFSRLSDIHWIYLFSPFIQRNISD